MSSVASLRKLKVSDLRDELFKRGLDTKGVKEDLIQRLAEADGNGEGEPEPASKEPAAPLEDATEPQPVADTKAPADSQTTESEKAKRRAERFGIAVVAPSGPAGQAPEDKERLKKRAERFGLPPPVETEEELEKKKKRAARFGLPAPVSKSGEEEKRLARAQRFQAASAGVTGTTEEVKAKLKARAERFGLPLAK